MSTTAHLGPCPPEMGVVSHMPKRQRPPKHARIKVKLDTVMGVAREMGRLIRLSYNGHLPPEELTKYIFALDKLRACLESAVAIDAAAAAQVKNEPTALTVNIITVPEGYSQQPDGSFRPMPLPLLEHTPEPELVPRSPQEAQLFAEWRSLSYDELLQRAKQEGLVGADQE